MKTARAMADAIARDLEWLDVYAPQAAAEARRVLNLGVPLADMIRARMAQATREGRDHLESTAGDVLAMREVISSDSSYAVPRDHVNHHGDHVLSWVPLWDEMSMREATAALAELAAL